MNEKAKELRTHMHEGHFTPAPAVPERKIRLQCNVRSESFRGNSNVVDFNGAGGENSPLHSISDGLCKWKSNQTCEIFSVPGSNTREIIKDAGNSFVLFLAGYAENVQCERRKDVSDLATQCDLEGATADNVNDNTFRNATDETYLDMPGGNTANHTAFLTYNGHDGAFVEFS
ncbi:hard-surface inducible [Fusarium sp. NRRL 25303]|nr:hard-surface inducible [Fusarium sp. NRRL 25303]